MKKEIADKWVAALRSGQYAQGSSFLRLGYPSNKNDVFCCLGVLCDITDKNKWEYDLIESVFTYENMYGTLPVSILNGAGFISSAETLDALITLNDIKKASFEEIADYIETNWEKL